MGPSGSEQLGSDESHFVERLFERAAEIVGDFCPTDVTQTLLLASKLKVVLLPGVRNVLEARAVEIMGSFSPTEKSMLASCVARGALHGCVKLERALHPHAAPPESHTGRGQPEGEVSEHERGSKRTLEREGRQPKETSPEGRARAGGRQPKEPFFAPAQLTSMLNGCPSLGRLKHHVEEQLHHLNGIHITVAFRVIERLVHRRGEGLRFDDTEMVRMLLSRAGEKMLDFNHHNFATTVHLVANLGVAPAPKALGEILARALDMAGAFSWSETENVRGAFRRWGVQLTPELKEALPRQVKTQPEDSVVGTLRQGASQSQGASTSRTSRPAAHPAGEDGVVSVPRPESRGMSGGERRDAQVDASLVRVGSEGVAKEAGGGAGGSSESNRGTKRGPAEREEGDAPSRVEVSAQEALEMTAKIAWCGNHGSFRDLLELEDSVEGFNHVHVVRHSLPCISLLAHLHPRMLQQPSRHQ